MRSIETAFTFPLSSVKPLEGLAKYREHCLQATRTALKGKTRKRTASPVGSSPLEPLGKVGDFGYSRCPETGGVFLAELPSKEAWAGLLKDVAEFRHSPKTFHTKIAGSRAENVYRPKLDWIENTLRIQGFARSSILDVATRPSEFSDFLKNDAAFQKVIPADEMTLCHGTEKPTALVDAAVLLESLDRVDDPVVLLSAVSKHLKAEGLLFVTALVYSGFDFTVLGLRNHYLYPPDRINCFTLDGLKKLITQAGFKLIEVSTPGVLDLEIVQAHRKHLPDLPLSDFERRLLDSDEDTRMAFQSFLQQRGLSSFARIVGRKV